MSKLPHIFTDASCSPSSTTLGIYSPQLKISKSITIPKPLHPHQAEELAFKLALKMTQHIDCHYFTDSMAVHSKYKDLCYWIPRELNKEADALSKKPAPKLKSDLGTTSIAEYIQKNYSLPLKLKLIATITHSQHTTIEKLCNNKVARSLLQALLTRDEKPKQFKAMLQATSLKQADLVTLIRTYQHQK